MGIRILICFYCLISLGANAQKMLDTTYFDSPIKYDIILAGSFGELRTTHFHAGIDIKPTKFNTEGDSIFVAGPGHISRIKIQSGGYGKVLYIDHPNGYTSVYAHMQSFQDSIEQYITELQRNAQSYEIDIYPKADKFTIPRGAFLGYLGNTGRSYGAHLHFEIRNTTSETPINPLLFGIGPDDNIAPDVPSVSIHGLSPDHQETHFSNYPTQKISPNQYTIGKGNVSIPAWRIGVLLQGWDRMDGASNKNGIYRIEMSVDDTLQYAMTVDSVNWDETAHIKTHVDYADRKKYKRTAVRCYQMPGNVLSIYDTTSKSGIFPIYSTKKRKVNIKAIDFAGNLSNINFDVYRNSNIKDHNITFEKHVKYDEDSQFTLGRATIAIPAKALDRDLYLSYTESEIENNTFYSIHRDDTPIYKSVQIKIPAADIDTALSNKICAVLIKEDGKLSYEGGTLTNDSLFFSTKTFGNYKIHFDTIPPVIEKIESQSKPYRTYVVKDDLSDVTVNAFIDNNWIIAPFKVLDHTLRIYRNDINVGSKNLKIFAEDANGNTREYIENLENPE